METLVNSSSSVECWLKAKYYTGNRINKGGIGKYLCV